MRLRNYIIAGVCGVLASIVAIQPNVAGAAIVYVDATASNTTPSTAIKTPPYSGADDNKWDIRLDFGEGSTVFESNEPAGTPGENSPLITTTVTGLAAGTYEVYVFYHALPITLGAHWNVQAAVSGNSLTSYDAANGTLIGPTPGPSSAISEYRALLGTVVSAGSVAVDIDDQGFTIADSRSWYDGIGYQLVPEPSSLILCISALAACGIGRRKRGA